MNVTYKGMSIAVARVDHYSRVHRLREDMGTETHHCISVQGIARGAPVGEFRRALREPGGQLIVTIGDAEVLRVPEGGDTQPGHVEVTEFFGGGGGMVIFEVSAVVPED